MRGCARARRWIDLSVDGELGIEERFLLDAHLERCADCRAELATLEGLEAALVSSPRPPVESLDIEQAVARVQQRLVEGESTDSIPAYDEPAGEPRRLAPRLIGLLVAAASVALVVRSMVMEPGTSGTVAPGDFEATDEIAASTDVLVHERLEEIRAQVAGELKAAWGGIPLLASRSEVEVGASRFEASTRQLARRWPRLRIVQGFVEGPDEVLAGASVRYLGLRGDTLVASALRDAIERPGLGAAAVVALGDLGERGLPGLGAALNVEEYRDLAIDQIVGVGGAEAAELLAEAVEERDGPQVRQLLSALADIEPAPVASVLQLTQRGSVSREDAFEVMRRMSDGAPALAALLGDRTQRFDDDLIFAALGELRPTGALPWLTERIAQRQSSDQALACVVAYRNDEGLEVLVRLAGMGRAPRDLLLGAAAQLLGEGPGAAIDLARRCSENREADTAAALLDLLLEVEMASTAEALTVLAFASPLSPDERLLAALAVGEMGDEETLEPLVAGMAALPAGQERLAAACLLATNSVGGPEAAQTALAVIGASNSRGERRLLDLLADARQQRKPAVTLYKVARELRPYYDTKIRTEVSGTL